MTAFSAYLTNKDVKKILSRKPADAGFSLIELVVVVAVLAILAAIAIPSFTSINDKARASAAANTLANVVKECAVEIANTGSGSYNSFDLDGYAAITGAACPPTGTTTLTVDPINTNLPSFTYNWGTGAKTCTPNVQNCSNGVW